MLGIGGGGLILLLTICRSPLETSVYPRNEPGRALGVNAVILGTKEDVYTSYGCYAQFCFSKYSWSQSADTLTNREFYRIANLDNMARCILPILLQILSPFSSHVHLPPLSRYAQMT